MVMSCIFTALLCISMICSLITGSGAALAASVLTGAQKGIELTLSLAGSICLWTGVGKLMEHAGLTAKLSGLLKPLLIRLFPSCAYSEEPLGALSGNICANLLGLGNAATPMGIRAVQLMKDSKKPTVATDDMCRLIVLNTASIQLIPANVAAVRASLGAPSPFMILPAVWITSLCSAGLGVIAAAALGRICRRD